MNVVKATDTARPRERARFRKVRQQQGVKLALLAAGMLMSLGLTHCGTARAQVARVAAVQHITEKKTGAAGSWQRVNSGAGLSVNDRCRTGKRSKADIKFTDGSLLRLAQLSSVEIRSAKGVTLVGGRLLYAALKPGRVLAGSATAEIKGSILIAAVNADGSSSFSLYSGAADIVTGGRAVPLPPGQAVDVASDGTLSTFHNAPPLNYAEGTLFSELISPPSDTPYAGSDDNVRDRLEPDRLLNDDVVPVTRIPRLGPGANPFVMLQNSNSTVATGGQGTGVGDSGGNSIPPPDASRRSSRGGSSLLQQLSNDPEETGPGEPDGDESQTAAGVAAAGSAGSTAGTYTGVVNGTYTVLISGTPSQTGAFTGTRSGVFTQSASGVGIFSGTQATSFQGLNGFGSGTGSESGAINGPTYRGDESGVSANGTGTYTAVGSPQGSFVSGKTYTRTESGTFNGPSGGGIFSGTGTTTFGIFQTNGWQTGLPAGTPLFGLPVSQRLGLSLLSRYSVTPIATGMRFGISLTRSFQGLFSKSSKKNNLAQSTDGTDDAATTAAVQNLADALDTSAAEAHLGQADRSLGTDSGGDIAVVGALGSNGIRGAGGQLHGYSSQGRLYLDVAARVLRVRSDSPAGGGFAGGNLTNDYSTFTSAFVNYRDPHGDIRVGRQRFLEGPTQAALFGSLVRQGGREIMDAVRFAPDIGKRQRLEVAYLYDAFPSKLPYRIPGTQHGLYGRFSMQRPFGNFGLNLFKYTNAPVSTTTGATLDFALPVIRNQIEFYGELGRDAFRRRLTTVGLTFPGLYDRSDFDLYLEYANLGNSNLAAAPPHELAARLYRRLNKNIDLVASVNRFSGFDTGVSVGLSIGARAQLPGRD